MSIDATTRADAAALSCLTANVAGYLGATEADPAGRIARSVRLAVRPDAPTGLLAFSHHRYSLGHLSDGRRLAYRGTSHVSTLVNELPDRIDHDGSVLVVAYAGSMPWSLAEVTDGAPHLVRVTARAGKWWEIDDAFTARLPNGQQQPFRGWITTTELSRAMTAPRAVEPEHLLRLRHAFGGVTAVPAGGRFTWVKPVLDSREPEMPAPPRWTTGFADVAALLGDYFAGLERHPERERLIDDLWAAAQHHTFRYTHLLTRRSLDGGEEDTVREALETWTSLPMSLHFAADSVKRGRPRAALVRTAFAAVADAEQQCTPVLERHGYVPGAHFLRRTPA
jgi:hypothetical protein